MTPGDALRACYLEADPPALRRKTLQLSRQLRDQAVEAQACYSLGNTYTLLQDYERAAEYHLRHLLIAQELADRCADVVGGAESCAGARWLS